jgi:hypothetical protein
VAQQVAEGCGERPLEILRLGYPSDVRFLPEGRRPGTATFAELAERCSWEAAAEAAPSDARPREDGVARYLQKLPLRSPRSGGAGGVALGLGRVLALYYRSSTLYQIH